MSIVSNHIGAIPSNFGNKVGENSNTDLSDKTFSDLLDKQMNAQDSNISSVFGMPAGFTETGTNIIDMISSVSHKGNVEQINKIDDSDIGTSEMVAFLTKPFDSHSALEHNNLLMDFAKRQASNFYNKCASNVVTNLSEFVEDSLKLS